MYLDVIVLTNRRFFKEVPPEWDIELKAVETTLFNNCKQHYINIQEQSNKQDDMAWHALLFLQIFSVVK